MINKINVPIDLSEYQSILILGIGGGFDIYCGLPFFHEYFHQNKNIVLANFSFTNFSELKMNTDSIFHSNNLVENGNMRNYMKYNPEGYLYEEIKEQFGKEFKVYSINKEGVSKVKKSLEFIVEQNNIDCILAIDGGVDSIFHGDEEGRGTMLEDTIVLTALSKINIKKFLICVGLTTEKEEKLCNYTAFKNISELYKDNAVYGLCSLTKDMECYKMFKLISENCWNKMGKKSHISPRIIEAIEGNFGGDIFINFLMNIYFFLDFDKILSKNILSKCIENTYTFNEAIIKIREIRLIQKRQDLIL